MKKHDDDLFEADNDPIWNAPAAKVKGKRRRERKAGPFYLCSEAWGDRAAEAAGQYLIMALRIYRRWQLRASGNDWITVGSRALAGAGPGGGGRGARNARLTLITRLEVAGLIEVAPAAPGRVTRVRVIDPQVQS
jgi:hypothetical protein